MISDIAGTLGFAFGVTGPIFFTVALGILLKRWGVIEKDFADKASNLVFMVALPALLFTTVVKTDISQIFDLTLLLSSLGATLLVFVLLSLTAPLFVKQPRDRGVYVQGAYRGNLAIVGIAFCANAYGDAGLAVASILMPVIMLLYNVLAAITLSASLNTQRTGLKMILVSIAKNPLIIAVVFGLLVNLIGLSIPQVLMESGGYLAKMTLPLALLCIGASLSFKEMSTTSGEAIWSSVAKLVTTPIIILAVVYYFGARGMELGVVFLLAASPTAAASYVMVSAMGGNAKLAANIIVISTLFSVVTVSLGLALLKSWQLI